MYQRARHLDTVCKSCEGPNKVCFGRCFKIVSSTYAHIDLGDVHRVMMVVLGRVRFWMCPCHQSQH